MQDLDSCSKCGRLLDYLSLKPYEMKWYCRKCYKEVTSTFRELDYCSKCGKVGGYLSLKPYEMKWYCLSCYKEITAKDKEITATIDAKLPKAS